MAWKNVQYENGKFQTGTGGGGGGVEDVTLDGVSVVNQQGVAVLTSPTIPVEDVTLDGTSVVNAQGVAVLTSPTIPVTDVTYGGSSVVNAQGVAEIPTATEVVANPTGTASTALTKLKVGNDIYSISGGGGNYHVYSTTEQVVGEWVDGKPIYEKSISFNNSSDTYFSIYLTGMNIKSVIGGEIWLEKIGEYQIIVPYYQSSSDYLNMYFDPTRQRIGVRRGSSAAYGSGYVTIRYTKTTD